MLIVDLSQELAIIEVSGTDCITYLQGQLTNDIKLLDKQSFQYSAYLNNKGRILASFIITKIEENTYHLITNKQIIDKIMPKLKLYILRSKVIINLYIHNHIIFTDHYLSDSIYSLNLTDNTYISLVRSHIPNNNNIQKINSWQHFLIKNGICMIYPNTYEKLIPQQVNYEQIGAISFNKGCYIGQEIVARMHYLGKAKRLMYKFICDTLIQIGQSVISPLANNQEIGLIIDVIAREYDYIGLVSIQNDYIENAFIIDMNNNHHQLLIQGIIHPSST